MKPLPWWVWVLAALAYLVSPIDLIPDILPVIGYGDDLGVGILALLKAKKTKENHA